MQVFLFIVSFGLLVAGVTLFSWQLVNKKSKRLSIALLISSVLSLIIFLLVLDDQENTYDDNPVATNNYAERFAQDVPSITNGQIQLPARTFDFVSDNVLLFSPESEVDNVIENATTANYRELSDSIEPFNREIVTTAGMVDRYESMLRDGMSYAFISIIDLEGNHYTQLQYKQPGALEEGEVVALYGVPVGEFKLTTSEGEEINSMLLLGIHSERGWGQTHPFYTKKAILYFLGNGFL
ncbi:hypothetical protein FLK61_27030 [Paenalkalicoccus suaedae]|uniref:Uncharacterized protein n=1 Tax=Paenalkalicoccus suaedae TaxID=2592382 RepID=A0A859FAW8_9BACI|nr:hypothetical protein [Paenalkalicoccus suaedae]QKS70409.1 hypothetical protein FLK61_27030 [Paenalkalicoccus suaedae]